MSNEIDFFACFFVNFKFTFIKVNIEFSFVFRCRNVNKIRTLQIMPDNFERNIHANMIDQSNLLDHSCNNKLLKKSQTDDVSSSNN